MKNIKFYKALYIFSRHNKFIFCNFIKKNHAQDFKYVNKTKNLGLETFQITAC